MREIETEILICGCGITGLTIARELLQRGYLDITIIEKEETVGLHASGRNSGVLHAGIYYSPDSMKAQSCINGNRLMKKYCRENGLSLLESGKVIVAGNEEEVEILNLLYNRAKAGGTDVAIIDEKELSEIEPFARTISKALYSPETAVVDPLQILNWMYNSLSKKQGVDILFNTRFEKIEGSNKIKAGDFIISYDRFINAAGAFSDKIAHVFGVGRKYRLIPFKGTYRKLNPEKSDMVHGNIYPVPDIKNPFLGVHFTRSISGDVIIGPTAIPAFGRENYGFLKGIDIEGLDIFFKDMYLFFKNSAFRYSALNEPRKYFKNYFFKDAHKLLNGIDRKDVIPSNKSGIRPQLINWETLELEMDFIVEKDGDSVHILNAISPAFTSSMEFARIIAENYF